MSTTKTITHTKEVLTEYKTGPDAAGKLRKCIACHEDIEAGQRWLKITRPGQYSIGVHTSCMARQGHKLTGDIATERRFGPGMPVGMRP